MQLTESSITHAGVRPARHPRLGVEIPAQSAVRYMRFRRRARIEHLELGRCVYGRWVPSVPCHPAHLVVSVLDDNGAWQTVREIDLPEEPAIAGEGLSQDSGIEEMEAHFQGALQRPPHRIELDGLETDHLRVECDREHPVWPSHGECNGGPFNVPFGILEPLIAHGDWRSDPIPLPSYHPSLKSGTLAPAAPAGMSVIQTPQEIRFAGERLAIGFSTRRPILTHLGWDLFGSGADLNRLRFFGPRWGASGPVLRTLALDGWSRLWTGTISCRGNRVEYSDLHIGNGVRVDAAFTVEPDAVLVELRQGCDRDVPVLEAEAWRFVWDLTAGNTAVAGLPTMAPGRNGDVRLPFAWATDGQGCLSCRRTDGEPDDVRLQVETYRQLDHPGNSQLSGIVLGPAPAPDAIQVLPAGERTASFDLRLDNLQPDRAETAPEPGEGLTRHWGTVFACFRPEYRGFSNNAASTNCHVNQGPPVEIAVHTRRPRVGPDPVALARFTIGRAVMDGGGYGYHRSLYLDSDPILVSAVGRIHQAAPDREWLRSLEPGLHEAINRMAATIGEEGLALCRDLSGNSGSFRWSSNAMDVVGFGHMDAYVNAWTYRAFRNAEALMVDLGHKEKAARCRRTAGELRSAYPRYLLNPDTGWVAGWRSRDGQLHDYAFTWVNGVACAFGLLPPSAARDALSSLERLREQSGAGPAALGLPTNLLPIDERDHMLPRVLGAGLPTFETYTDGGVSGVPATYYLRALSIHGLKDRAAKLAEELEAGYAAGNFSGGIGTGVEFRSWEGIPNGYEGTLIVCFGALYAIAVEQGIISPREPEWWPDARH